MHAFTVPYAKRGTRIAATLLAAKWRSHIDAQVFLGIPNFSTPNQIYIKHIHMLLSYRNILIQSIDHIVTIYKYMTCL